MVVPFIPSPHEEEVLRAGTYDFRQWKVEEEAANPAPPTDNVRFAHNPKWREENFMSIQAVHDRSHSGFFTSLFWDAVRDLFIVGNVAYWGGYTVRWLF